MQVDFFLFLIFLYVLLGIDDIIIDFIFWFKRLRPRLIDEKNLEQLLNLSEKKIALMVAAWKEYEVIEKMVVGNTSRLVYQQYEIFIGVYPNDEETYNIVKKLDRKFKHVHMVVNQKEGPTSKGQMLNQVMESIFLYEETNQLEFGGVVFHDCEDIIHPYSFKLFNHLLGQNDFIQVPIFSLPTPALSLVAGTYMDEFAEWHVKDICVRSELNCSIPSAGVGTCLSHRFIKNIWDKNKYLFNQNSLTEDYELGVSSWMYNLKSTFASYTFKNDLGEIEHIATREYFPKKFIHSVKQKTRWTLGIVFQGIEHLGWSGNLVQKFFFWRDRKGPLSSLVAFLGMVFFIVIFYQRYFTKNSFDFSKEFQWGFLLTMGLMVNRLFQRTFCTYNVYGFQTALLVFPRVIISNVINFFASMRACYQYANSKIRGVLPEWSKTEHELLEGFGEEINLEDEIEEI